MDPANALLLEYGDKLTEPKDNDLFPGIDDEEPKEKDGRKEDGNNDHQEHFQRAGILIEFILIDDALHSISLSYNSKGVVQKEPTSISNGGTAASDAFECSNHLQIFRFTGVHTTPLKEQITEFHAIWMHLCILPACPALAFLRILKKAAERCVHQ